MVEVHVSAGLTLLEGFVKRPANGVCELVWNAFDEDATEVRVEVERSSLGAVELIRVVDNGNGMTPESASRAFSRIGDSWKNAPNATSASGRAVHGKHGRGRYAAFSLGEAVSWRSTGRSLEGPRLASVNIRGRRSSLDRFEIDEQSPPGSQPGTSVEITEVTLEAARAFESADSLRDRLLTECALAMERYNDFGIDFLGTRLDPGAVIVKREEIALLLPDGVEGIASLTIIEWNLKNVERRLYLCTGDGAVVGEMPPRVHSVGAEFTAYVSWDGFVHDHELILDEESESPPSLVINAARVALREYLGQAQRVREADVVRRWRAEGVYPYNDEPSGEAEAASRTAFNLVAMAASRTVDEAKTSALKALSLSLLRETFESDPAALLPLLRKFAQLPAARIDELADLLERTTLSNLISVGHEIGARVDFLHGLNAILFDKPFKRHVLERRQLHRILANETWVFGEEWSLTGDDERLTEVLKNHLELFGGEVELVGDGPVVREDGSDGIPDLVLGRQLETGQNEFRHLVVELKRPSHKLDDNDVTQIRSYASAIANDERFDQDNSHWDFWLVGNEVGRAVDEARHQQGLPVGVVQESRKYRITVKTWAEIIGDAEHRLKFVQRSLAYESSRDQGVAAMRERYAQYLPIVEGSLPDPEDEPEVA